MRAPGGTPLNLPLPSDLGDRHIMVLRNHGLLVVGASIAEPFLSRRIACERACAMQLAFFSNPAPNSTRSATPS